MAFSFSDKPVISYSNNELVVAANSVTIQFPLAKLRKITIEGSLDEALTDITAAELPDTKFSFSRDQASVRGEEPGTPVYVYDLNGVMCAQGVIDAQGKADIPLSSLSSGIYVVKTKKTSFKISVGR